MREAQVPLPAATEAPRCATWTRAMQLAPAGTAIRADVLLLLDVPSPWPKPVKDHPRLVGMMDVVAAAEIPTRLLASVPVDDRIRLTVFRNSSGRGVRSTYIVASEAAIPEAITATAEGAQSSQMSLVEQPAARPSLLVCTQGTHDICCGSDGVRLSSDVERNLPHIDVYRVSHTGGHRFAPTAMTMPDGRMWAWLDVDDVRAIIERTADHRDLARRCRGWWGAEKGEQQAAELAVFSRFGWEAAPTSVVGEASPYEVRLADRSVEVRVEAIRTVPTIACRSPGGLPTKTSVEHRAVVV